MVDTKTLLRASLEASKDLMKSPMAHELEGPRDDASAKVAPLIVPIRSLGENHRERLVQHLMALDSTDRYLRFGYSATDEHIRRYIDGLNFERDEIFGIYNRKLELVAMAHLALIGKEAGPSLETCAEFGVSVLKEARGLGLGSALFDRAAMHARNDGVQLMFIHALSENDVMLKIARNAGARVEKLGSESEAYLCLTPPTLDSRLTEIVEEQVAQMDYRLKVQAKQFWDFWATVQGLGKTH
jgi:GNAT superfamily N-acetyltransferase